MNYVGEKKIDTIDLFIYYKHGEESSFLYEDEGDGYGYQQGHSLQRTFSLKGSSTNLHLTQTIKGSYSECCTQFSLFFIGFPFIPRTIYIDGHEIRLEDKSKYWSAVTSSPLTSCDFFVSSYLKLDNQLNSFFPLMFQI